ncbi:MAG: nodulation protein NfeD [Candidatus Omnitrophica bacterium]|nr:nodulation protein NfeD [Candidatus Omnitrophota bacterium]
MKKIFLSLILAFLPLPIFAQQLKLITISDYIIGPPTVAYIKRGLKEAERKDAILIIQLDTPGGLLKSTQEITKLLLNTSVPVVTYIAPKGARVASAGVFISYASHILAMAPSTHIGSAHPILGGGSWGKLSKEVKEKIINDTLAWAENLANQRNRPVKFIKEAIRKSISITEKEAKRLGVCEVVAKNLEDLKEKLQGMKVIINGKMISLTTRNFSIEKIPFSGRERFLNIIIDPNIAYLLLTLGFLGLIFEVTHPGFGFPGIAGILCLILSLYALTILPVNYAGVALIILGIIFLVAEVFTPTFGMFTFAGITSLLLGSLFMFNQPRLVKVSYKIFVPVILSFAILSLFLLGKIISSQRQKPKTGIEGLVGKEGIALTDIDKKGKVLVHSEVWNAFSSDKIKKEEKVVIEKVEGLNLFVKRKEA